MSEAIYILKRHKSWEMNGTIARILYGTRSGTRQHSQVIVIISCAALGTYDVHVVQKFLYYCYFCFEKRKVLHGYPK